MLQTGAISHYRKPLGPWDCQKIRNDIIQGFSKTGNARRMRNVDVKK